MTRRHAATLRSLVAMLAWLVVLGWNASAGAQDTAAPMSERLANDIREQVNHLNVVVRDVAGTEFKGRIAVTSFRPPGDGPFPVALMSHGRAPPARRATPLRQRYEVLARYLVSKGFAVVVPTRLGYGETFGLGDPEAGGSCDAVRFEAMSMVASEQVLQVVESLRTQPWADVSRWVAMGQSVGGLVTVALAWRHASGLVAAINFSGGAGGNPETRARLPCSPELLERLWHERSGQAPVPMLWMYWHNDLYWGEHWPQRWASAWAQGGGKLEFHQLPAAGKDGHNGSAIDMDTWVPLAEQFLGHHGFKQSGIVHRPAAVAQPRLDDLAALPAGANTRAAYQSKFLASKPPRAFAIGASGQYGWASGDWAMGRALGACAAPRGTACKLYAVDDDVVWAP